MPTNPFLEILNHLQSTGFKDVAGTRLSGTIPLSERLINEVVAASIPRGGHVREAHVRPEPGGRLSVRVAPRAALLPSLTLKLQIERQPEFPGNPVLVLRMAKMGGLLGMASAALPIAGMLPPGVRLDGERILVDIRAMAAQRGFADLLAHVKQLNITTDAGRVLVQVDAGVD